MGYVFDFTIILFMMSFVKLHGLYNEPKP